ncbi:MAG: MaoC family dehydratase [Polyangiales bacterium]
MRVRQPGLRLDAARIEAYRRVCGYEAQGWSVPLAYPELHFTPLMAEAILSRQFPLSPLGLIHVGQSVEQHEALAPGERVDASTELAALRETGRGYEVDFSMTLERHGKTVWTGVATMLSRSPQNTSTRRRQPRLGPVPGTEKQTPKVVQLTVPARTGRAYARVSGDWNPHHLWWFTALPLGYRRPIAHGMWTFARALAIVLREVDQEVPLQASASFKRPLLMPGRIEIDAPNLSPDTRSVKLAVRDAASRAPHLLGQLGLDRLGPSNREPAKIGTSP